jgi:D-lactate dehydrogenase (cytochrome)
VQTYSLAKKELPETLSAFEVFDNDSVNCVRDQNYQEPPNSPFPISDQSPIYVVLESAGKEPKFEDQKANQFLSLLKEQQLIEDGAIARTSEERLRYWSWRTKLPRAIVQNGPSSIHFDISLPLPRLYQLVNDTREWAHREGLIPNDIVAIYGYGHVGDGNLHLTIPALRDDQKLVEKVDDFVYAWTAKYQGSISAEHGVGLMKSPYLAYTKSATMIQSMRKIKDLFDPNQIMNPYKIFPTEEQEEEGELIRRKHLVGC